MTIRVEHVPNGWDLSDAFAIREAVFQDEQSISQSDDFDGLDTSAEQFLAFDDDLAVGTARYRTVSNSAKVERLAVLRDSRGQGVGRMIMETLLEHASSRGLVEATLDSQFDASGFYEGLGFDYTDPLFEEVGIPHIRMTKTLIAEVIDYPGDWWGEEPEWVQPPDPEPGIESAEGYERHQNDVQAWLSKVANCKINRPRVDDLRTLAGRYGVKVSIKGEEYEAKLKKLVDDDPRDVSLALQKEHIDLVILSPILSLFQKADLLTMSAQALYYGRHPVNGKTVVQRELKLLQKRILSITQDPQTARQAREFSALHDHMDSLDAVTEDGLPSMTRRELYKHAASIEYGEPVTNIFKALAILLTVSDQPSLEQIRKREARALSYAEQRQQRSYEKLERNIAKTQDLKERSRQRRHT